LGFLFKRSSNMFCCNCGHNLPNEADKFCPKCGTSKIGQSQNHNVNTFSAYPHLGNGNVTTPDQGRGMAIAGLILGILAMSIPIPVLDVILGVVGLILALIAKPQVGSLRTAAIVVSIVGLIIAILFTIIVLSSGLIFS